MLGYKKKGYEIEVPLPEECGYKGYTVKCVYSYDKTIGKYYVDMGLTREDIRITHEIDSQYITSDKKHINQNISRFIELSSLSGYFDKYIKNYEYTYLCFDRGNEIFEKERLDVE